MNHRRVSCILCTVAFVCIRERNLGYAAESTPDQVPAYAEKQTLSASVSPLPLFMSTAGARNVWSPTLSRSRWVSFALSFVHPILLHSLLIHSLFFFYLASWHAGAMWEKRTFFSDPSSNFTSFIFLRFCFSAFLFNTYTKTTVFHRQRITCGWWSSCPAIVAPVVVSWLPCKMNKKQNKKQ